MTDEKRENSRVPNSGTRPTKVKVPIGLFWMVLGVIVLVFSVYEVIEQTWLVDVEMQIIHYLHIIRGVTTCILVTLLVVWYLLRSGLPIFPPEPLDSDWAAEEDSSAETRVIHFNRWFIRMRWLACIMATALVIVTVQVLRYLEGETLVPLSLLIVALVLSNLVFTQMLNRRWCVRHLVEIQMGTDLVILTAMLHFSGGIENPMAVAYIFHIIIGGILLDWRKCYALVFVASALFAGLAFAEMRGYVKHYTLLVFPHRSAQGAEEPDEHERPRGLLGTSFEDTYRDHASHDPVYVVSITVLQTVLLVLTAHFILTIMDQLGIEERHRQAVRQRLERVVQATGAGFSILDSDLQALWLNDQIREWLNVSGHVSEEERATVEQWCGGEGGPAASTLLDGKVRAVERHLVDGEGNKRFFQTTVSPLTDNDGKVYQIVELTQDITERKMLEAETIHAGRLAALGVLAAGIAHEIGNPLASIATWLRLMEKKRDKQLFEDGLPLLQDHIDRLTRIVQDISQFARPAREERTICQVNTLVADTLTLLRFHRQTKAIQIGTELASGLPDIMAKRDELIQVFLNLGLNAIEAMAQDGNLTIMTYLRDEELCAGFSDTGPGISEEIRARLFEPFFTSKDGGLGLGLSIAHKIIIAHGGRIEVENNPGGGALFTVVLPIRTGLDVPGTAMGSKQA